jgi:DNA-binding transcriptional ArsR family regulator
MSVAELSADHIRVVASPLITVTCHLVEAVGRNMGTPASWIEPVRQTLQPCDVALLVPVYGPTAGSFLPDCLFPGSSIPPTFEDELSWLAEVDPDSLECELVDGGHIHDGWSEAARSPRAWLRAYVAAVGRAWTAVRSHWDRATPLMEREVERVGIAVARGSFGQLLGRLAVRSRVVDDRCYFTEDDQPAVINSNLVLRPMVSGLGARIVLTDDGAVSGLAYPLPGAHRLDDHEARPARPSGLEALLGEPRSDIVRRLDVPSSAGQLATQLLYAPSAITHHLSALERSGLVRRERSGKHVIVHRTARGTALLDLYES